MRLIYLYGLAGPTAEPSPALRDALGPDDDIVIPDLPGFNGRPNFVPPADYLEWLTVVWDALDATGALPCPVVGASVGGMLAADLAVFRPEAVTKLVLMGPLGLWDAAQPGTDPFGVPMGDRLPLLFQGDVPEAFTNTFEHVDGPERAVARYLVTIAAASLVWPIADHGFALRSHRLRTPTLLLWGECDRVVPAGMATRWPARRRVVVPGAGHMVEWDAPDAVSAEVGAFLREP
jgi:pimeloyl-ACP methyl ester carboxylesterase